MKAASDQFRIPLHFPAVLPGICHQVPDAVANGIGFHLHPGKLRLRNAINIGVGLKTYRVNIVMAQPFDKDSSRTGKRVYHIDGAAGRLTP